MFFLRNFTIRMALKLLALGRSAPRKCFTNVYDDLFHRCLHTSFPKVLRQLNATNAADLDGSRKDVADFGKAVESDYAQLTLASSWALACPLCAGAALLWVTARSKLSLRNPIGWPRQRLLVLLPIGNQLINHGRTDLIGRFNRQTKARIAFIFRE